MIFSRELLSRLTNLCSDIITEEIYRYATDILKKFTIVKNIDGNDIDLEAVMLKDLEETTVMKAREGSLKSVFFKMVAQQISKLRSSSSDITIQCRILGEISLNLSRLYGLKNEDLIEVLNLNVKYIDELIEYYGQYLNSRFIENILKILIDFIREESIVRPISKILEHNYEKNLKFDFSPDKMSAFTTIELIPDRIKMKWMAIIAQMESGSVSYFTKEICTFIASQLKKPISSMDDDISKIMDLIARYSTKRIGNSNKNLREVIDNVILERMGIPVVPIIIERLNNSGISKIAQSNYISFLRHFISGRDNKTYEQIFPDATDLKRQIKFYKRSTQIQELKKLFDKLHTRIAYNETTTFPKDQVDSLPQVFSYREGTTTRTFASTTGKNLERMDDSDENLLPGLN